MVCVMVSLNKGSFASQLAEFLELKIRYEQVIATLEAI